MLGFLIIEIIEKKGTFILPDEKVWEMKDEIIKSVQEAVQIKSVEDKAKDGMPFDEGIQRTSKCSGRKTSERS